MKICPFMSTPEKECPCTKECMLYDVDNKRCALNISKEVVDIRDHFRWNM